MLRNATTDDREPILALVLASGLLEIDEVEAMGVIFDDSQLPGSSSTHSIWVVEEDSERIVAVAFAEPELMADGAWNPRLIAVSPDRQRQGRGAALLSFIECALAEQGGRLLVVDTSGHADFAGVRRFYHNTGYAEEATIRDFWQPGDDKIVFTKRIQRSAGPV